MGKRGKKKTRKRKHDNRMLPVKASQNNDTQIVENIQPQKTHSYKIQASKFSGPIPPPAILAEYDQLIAGGADRILKMAENQAEHRQSLEKSVIKSDNIRAYLGQNFAFIICMTGLCWAGYLILQGHGVEGCTIFGANLVSMASLFIYGKKIKAKELARKQ